MRNYELAIDRYTEAIEKDTVNVDFLSNRASCYHEMKEFENATNDLDDALKIDEKNSKLHYQQGLTYYAF